MEMESTAPETANAGITGSAPVAGGEGSTTTEVVPEDQNLNPKSGTTEGEGSEPTDEGGGGKVVKELIGVRKRAQAAELENARLKGLLEGAGLVDQTGNPVTKPKMPDIEVTTSDGKPTPPNVDDFEDFESYSNAEKKYYDELIDWKVSQKVAADKEQERRETANQEWTRKTKEAREKYDDFDLVIRNPAFGQSPAVVELIRGSDIGAEMAYFLGKNLDIANKLNGMNPFQAAKEFGKLEDKLMNPPAPEPRKLISQAPEPVKTVEAAGALEKDDQELPIDDFISKRNARDLARSRGQMI